MAEPDEALAPSGPWTCLRAALRGPWGFNAAVFIGVWVALQGVVPTLWSTHLRHLVGRSALPHYWGERLTGRDVQELLSNGGLQKAWTGFWTPLAAIILLFLVLWFGWRIQAEVLRVKARWAPWGLGLADAAAIGLVPLALLGWGLDQVFAYLGGTGIQGLGWLALVARGVLPLFLGSAFMVQWWFCRMARAAAPSLPLGRHLRQAFLALWSHPIQWGTLILVGVILRTALQAGPLLAGWRWGGGSPGKVWALLLLQVLAAAANAWIIALYLGLAARFWSGDSRVRQAVADLKRDFG